MAFDEDQNASLESPGIAAAFMAAMVLTFVSYFFFKSDPPPPPENSFAYGCYSAPSAPHALLNNTGFTVIQEGMEPIPFSLRRGKTGILLVLDATIEATKRGTAYEVRRTRNGGMFIPFYRESNGTIFGVTDESELEGFRLLMSDGRYLAYQPTADQVCASARKAQI